jgi:SnoaL-like polyketide cyclase.
MNRLLIAKISCCFIFLLSCKHFQAHMDSATSSEGDSTARNAAETNRANTVTIFKGIEKGDVSAMDNILTSDAIDHSDAGDVKGIEAIKKQLNDIHNHFNNLKFDLLSDATDGNYHFSLVKLSGTTKDTWMGMPAGTSISDTSIGLEKVTNGKVSEHWRFSNVQEMMKMMPPKK